ncbi:MAG: choice-of-anchor L domain-containing protein, partial [Bacteroidia bacterium]|nr:choice-of-anchor L domain-containing protein [Bacteroidia bacterium]
MSKTEIFRQKLFRLTLSYIVLFGTCMSLAAQIQVTPSFQPPYNPINLIEDVFLSDGIVIQSVVYEGTETGVGYFNTGSNDIDIERGVVMSTGFVNNIDRLNNSPGTSGATSGSTFTDADLELLAGNTVQDISRYIITFRPLSDTIRFRYVFASEEYPEFACGSFNDPFGFFLSGPGIAGPFSNGAENLALIPGTMTAVTVNSVNGGDGTAGCAGINEQFYNDNAGSPNLEFDGYLSVFEVVQAVESCEMYTLKIAIGDAGQIAGFGDNSFDSAVFLEGNSFSSNFANAARNTINQNGVIQEGCSSGSLDVTIPAPLAVNDTIFFNVGGNATFGTDYNLSSNGSIIIPAGDTIGTLTITALEDNFPEVNDTLIVSLDLSPCQTDTFYFFLFDNSLEDPDLGEDQTICLGESVQLYPTFIPTPSSEMTFTNSMSVFIPDASSTAPGPTVYSDLMVSGVEPTLLGPGVIKSVCIDILHFWDEDLSIFLEAPDGSFIELSTDNGGQGNNYTMTCFVNDETAPMIAEPGMLAPESATPFTGSWRPEGNWSDLWANGSPTNGQWRLAVFDSKEIPSTNHFIQNFSITFNATYQVNYDWNITDGLSCTDCANPIASPATNTEYILDVTDNNGCQKMDTILITVIDTIRAPVPVCASNNP